MRTCQSCHATMLELMIVDQGHRASLLIKSDDKRRHLGEVKCSVCPKCGNISLHVDDLSRLQNYLASSKDR